MMGDPPEDEVEHLLARWKRGDRDDGAWYRVLRKPMRRQAWRGVQRMTGNGPNQDDVGEVLYEAFTEFLDRDPRDVTSPVGLAASIAFRRGQDMGRKLNRSLEFPDSETVAAQGDPPLGPEEVVLQAEQTEERERVLALALECLEELPPGQAEVVRATIMRQQNISDWANENGKSYQAADQQRNRGLNALKRCVEAKQRQGGGDHVV